MICCEYLSRYLVNPICVHLIVAKHVMRYLKGMIYFGLYYDGYHDYKLYGYANSYWDGSTSNRKSTSSECYYLGSAMISWFSKKQSNVALNTIEVEYIATCSASCEAIWLRKMMLVYST